MRKLITKAFDIFCQVGVVLLLLGGLIGGYSANGIGGAISGLIGAALLSVILFGVLFVLMEIRDNTARSAQLLADMEIPK
ncbi:MAG: hypothetical protein PVF51_02785 [Nitrospirota bacterium]|jgi:hypothetical protein